MSKALSAVAVVVLFALTAAYAGTRDGPRRSMFPDLCTAEMRAMLDEADGMVVVDARTVGEYYRAHLPGAINVPPKKLQQIASFLPDGKEVTVVFYSRGFG